MAYLGELEEAVWTKGRVIVGFDANVWRHDVNGTVIQHDAYGNRQSEYGWEIDHIVPVSQRGSNALSNLRPLHWRANASRQP